MPLKNDELFWKKKEFISFILSILVFFIHSYFAKDVGDGSTVNLINHKVSYFLSCSITRFAVPAFFMLSGITFFKDYNNKKYLPKMKARIFTLVIPYLIWNTVWMLWEIFTSHSFLARFSDQSEPFALTVGNILKGIFFYGNNVPFWFVFDLIVFSFAAPLVFAVIKNKYVGFAAVAILTVASLFGIYLPMSVFYYPMAIVFYLMGAIVGYHYFHVAAKPSSKPIRIAAFVYLAAYILAKNIAPVETHIDNYFTQTVVYTLAAISLWIVTDAFIGYVKPRAIYRRSFAVYAMHLNVAIMIIKTLNFTLPKSPWLELPKFIVMVVATLVIINLVCAFLERFAPKLNGLLFGNRVKK